jgi:hypothetical protein
MEFQLFAPAALGQMVVVGGRRQTSTVDVSYLLTLLEGGLAYVNTLAAIRSETLQQRYQALFQAGREEIWRHHPNARPHWDTLGTASA